MDPDVKLAVIDERHWFPFEKTQCRKCKHLLDFADNYKCSGFSPELPPEYWNGEKPCPKREEKPDSLPQKT